MSIWEYRVIQPEVTKLEDLTWVLNENGKEGWELVSVTFHKYQNVLGTDNEFDQYTMFFKRPK